PQLRQCLAPEQLVRLQAAVEEVHVADALLDYLQRLIAYTRSEPGFAFGLSPRGALALLRAARAWALMARRGHVVPEDIQQVLPAVVEHRLHAPVDYSGGGGALVERLLRQVPVI